jgi:hypothetical protein
MKEILKGMHARIGAGRSGELHWLPVKGMQNLLQGMLNCRRIVLHLKARITGALVGYFKQKTHGLIAAPAL